MTAALRTTVTRYGGVVWVLVCAFAVAIFLLYARVPATGTESAAPDAAQIANGPVAVGKGHDNLAPGVSAVAVTARGTFALTGVVVSATTGRPLQGAHVVLAGGSRVVTTRSDASGGWSFANVGSPLRAWTITIDAAGYGTFVQANNTFSPGTAYEMTSALTPKTRR